MSTFKVDDKIFGKVKGYPAWPAKVTGVNGKRYNVVFYGTNETATLKPENIVYYLKNKPKYTNLQKRKYFNEAIIDIEEDIKSCGGSDGSPDDAGSTEVPKPKVGNKRKRRRLSTGNSSVETASKRLKAEEAKDDDCIVSSQESDGCTPNLGHFTKVDKETNTLPQPEAVSTATSISLASDLCSTATETSRTSSKDAMSTTTSEETETDSRTSEDNPIFSRRNVPSTIAEVTELDETSVCPPSEATDVGISSPDWPSQESISKPNEALEDSSKQLDATLDDCSSMTLDMTSVCLLPEFFLPAVKTYAEKVKSNASFYKSIPPDPASIYDVHDTRLKILPVRLAENRYAGLIYEEKGVSRFASEYERAIDDLSVVESIFALQSQLQSASRKDLSSRGIKVVHHLDCDDEFVRTSTHNALIAYKKAKLQWLRTELLFFKMVCDVKKCLRHSHADTPKALELLHMIHDMPITRITLKKRPTLIDTIVRLTKYVGRPSQWHLSAEEAQQFEKDAAKIRCVANEIYAKVKALFDRHDGDFPTYFRNVCNDFFDAAKEMTEMDMFSLCAEPYSRRALIELIYDAQTTSQ